MVKILEINNLSYNGFNKINMSFNEKSYYSIIGSNNCGKTTLFKLIAGFIPSNNTITCNNIDLNPITIGDYITNLGVVSRVNKKSFTYNKVLDEMMYPLCNLGYSKSSSLDRIKEVLNLFNANDFLNKSINELDYYDKHLLLIMIAILHKPKVLLIDSVLEIFSFDIRKEIVKVLKKIVNNGMTVISFTNLLDEAYYSDKIILLDNYKIIGEYTPDFIYQDDKLFYEHNLEIPFLVDLSIKLKMYGLINKEYKSMKEMVDDLWP